jgi:hypothetical protein
VAAARGSRVAAAAMPGCTASACAAETMTASRSTPASATRAWST